MWRQRLRPVPGGTRAFVYSLILHITVLLLLGVGLRFSARTPEPPRVVPATVVEEVPKKPAAEPPDTARLEEQRRREAEAERARREQLKRQEEERRRAEAARRQKLAEEAARKEAQRKQELEQKRRAEERRRQEAAEAALRAEIAAEEERRAEARALTAVERYKGLIRQKVSRHWNRPVGSPQGLQCTVRVRLGPGGAVLSAAVVRTSGDAAFDRSVENAVYKAEPLPVPEEAKVFEYFRDIEFVFIPES